MKGRTWVGGAIACVLSTSFQLPPCEAESPFEGFADRIEEQRKAWGAPGLAVAVVHEDEVVLSAGFGVRDVSTGKPVDEHTLFHVGSTTKAYTAAAFGLLCEDGKLGWEDKVVDHLPGFRVADPEVTSQLTILDLLTHRTGVQNTDLLWKRGVPTGEFVPRLVHARQSSALRSRFEYNNGMYVVAGQVIEAVSGQGYADFVRGRLFLPLGMKRTTGPRSEISRRKNVATSHEKIEGAMTPIGLVDFYDAGAAGLFYSSVSEQVNWLRIWLNDGKLGDAPILKPSTIQTAFEPQVDLPGPIYPAARAAGIEKFAYGLGWFAYEYRGHSVRMHTGSIDGMSALIGLMPDESLGVVVFINADHVELRHALLYETFDRVLGGEPRDWSGELRTLYQSLADRSSQRRSQRIASLDSTAQPQLSLEGYSGLYSHPLFGDVEVAFEKGSLALRAAPLMSFHLKPGGRHIFIAYPLRRGFEKEESDARRYSEPTLVQFKVGEEDRPEKLLFAGTAFERTPGSQER